MKILGYASMIFSGLGLVGAVVATLVGLVSRQHGSPGPYFFVLFALFFLGVVTSIPVQKKATENLTQRQAKGLELAGCPKWMKVASRTLSAAGMALFFGLALTGRRKPQNEQPELLIFGAFGLAAFSALFAQAYSSMHRLPTIADRRCPAGHPVSVTARFCEICGAMVQAE